MGTSQLIKLLMIPLIVALEYYVNGRCVSATRAALLVCAACSIGFSVAADLDFEVQGVIIALLTLPFSAVNKVLIATLTRDLGVAENELVHVICLPTLLTLCLVASVKESPLWPAYLSVTTQRDAALLVASGSLAVLVIRSNVLMLRATSALTTQLAGMAKTAVLMLCSVLVFGSHVTAMQLGCGVLAIAALIAHAWLVVAAESAVAVSKEQQ